MKKILLVFLVGIVVSCKNFEWKKVSSKQIYQNELQHLNWNDLDTYPAFKDCEEYVEKVKRKKCFEEEISRHIYSVFQQHKIILKDSVHQKMILVIAISEKGKPSLDTLLMTDLLRLKMPHIKMWLDSAITNLPKIYPGEKRGVPVASKFKLPLVISAE